MSIRAAIVGPTGYIGYWLIQLLLRHPSAAITYLASRRDPPPNVHELFGALLGRLPDDIAACRPIDPPAIARAADVAFVCLPPVAAMEVVPQLLAAGLRVIDLSADYRLRNPAVYEQAYEHEHTDAANLSRARYGLPELFRDDLADAQLIANPGCYPNGAGIAAAPLLARKLVKADGIIINAASGVTGAGRTPKPHLQFAEHNESFNAYGTIGGHRHQPEIVQTLSRVAGTRVDLLFVPHLLPIDRGILETIYLDPVDADLTPALLFAAFEQAYDDEPFVRVRNDLPNVKHVRDTNFCDVSVRMVSTQAAQKVVVFCALDNMIKGGSGQAVQNMNLMFGQDETAGLL